MGKFSFTAFVPNKLAKDAVLPWGSGAGLLLGLNEQLRQAQKRGDKEEEEEINRQIDDLMAELDELKGG